MTGTTSDPTAVRLFDSVLGFLLRPRVRRVRRWSFVVTLPVGVVLGRSVGIGLGDGALLGVLAAVLEFAIVVGVALAGTRLLGPERRDALLDLLMHPVARRAVIGEVRTLATLPGALVRRLRPPAGEAFSYHRGTSELGLAIALLPAMLAEAVVVHLLLPAGWYWPKLVLAALHAYGALMLLSWAVGQRTCPHRLGGGWLELRGGQLYRAATEARQIVDAQVVRRRDGQRTGLVLQDGVARLAVSGRTDVRLRFAAPVVVERPLADPVEVTELHVAVDEPARFVASVTALSPARPPAGPAPATRRAPAACLTPIGLAEALGA